MGRNSYLAAQIPELYGDSPPCDLTHVEPHCGNHVFVERAGCYDVHQRCFASILQTDQGELHLFLKEEAAWACERFYIS